MMNEVFVAAVSAAVGAATVPVLSRVKQCLWPKKKAPFEPGFCDELPLHLWSWVRPPQSKVTGFTCPKCSRCIGKDQPPYCAERGGHFHFKCFDCGYEWAMRTWDYEEPKPAPAMPPMHPAYAESQRRPIPGSGAS